MRRARKQLSAALVTLLALGLAPVVLQIGLRPASASASGLVTQSSPAEPLCGIAYPTGGPPGTFDTPAAQTTSTSTTVSPASVVVPTSASATGFTISGGDVYAISATNVIEYSENGSELQEPPLPTATTSGTSYTGTGGSILVNDGTIYLFRSAASGTSYLVAMSASTGAELWDTNVGGNPNGMYSWHDGSGSFAVAVLSEVSSTDILISSSGTTVGTGPVPTTPLVNWNPAFVTQSPSGGFVMSTGGYVYFYDASGHPLSSSSSSVPYFGSSTSSSEEPGSALGLNNMGAVEVGSDVFVGANAGILEFSPTGVFEGLASWSSLGVNEQFPISALDYDATSGDLYVATDASGGGIDAIPLSSVEQVIATPAVPTEDGFGDALGVGAGLSTPETANYFASGTSPSVTAGFDPWWRNYPDPLELRYWVAGESQVTNEDLPASTSAELDWSGVASGASLQIPLELSADSAPGVYLVNADLVDATTKLTIGSTCLTYSVGMPGDALDFSSLPSGEDYGGPGPVRGVALAAALGTGLYREQLNLSTLLPNCTSTNMSAATCGPSALTNWSTYDPVTEEAAALAAKDGVDFEVQVGASGSGITLDFLLQNNTDSNDVSYWQEDVQAVMQHFAATAPDLHYFEVFNEPNNEYSASSYVSLVLVPFYEAAQAANATDGASATGASVAAGTGFTGQLNVAGASGVVTYTEASSEDSSDVVVSSDGAVTAASTLAAGSYTVSGTDSDGSGDTGTWSFTLTVEPSGSLAQAGPQTASVADGLGYTGQLGALGASGTITYTETSSADSSDIVVASNGAVSASASLAPGTYTVSGTDSDGSGDTGTWSFALTVEPSGTLTQTGLTSSDVSDGAGYVGELDVLGANPNWPYASFSEASSASSGDVVVASSGAISASTSLAPGTYTVSGTDNDSHGDTGTWTFTLTVEPSGLLTQSSDQVVGGSVVGEDLSYWQQIAAAGGFRYMNIAGFHPYPSYDRSFEEQGTPAFISSLRSLMDENGAGAMPMWDTEQGWWSDGEQAFYDVGDWAPREWMWLKALGVSSWNYFITEGGYNGFGTDYSLIQAAAEDDYLKPGAIGLMTVANLLGNRPFVKQVSLPIPHAYGMLFGPSSTSDTDVLALWTDDLTVPADLTTTSASAIPLQTTAALGSSGSLSVASSSPTALTLSGAPLYLTIPAADANEISVEAAEAFGDNLALASAGASATATSSQSGYPASNAIAGSADANLNGGWEAAASDTAPSLTVTLASPQTIDRVLVATSSIASVEPGLRDYDVQVEVNGAFTTVGTVTNEYFEREKLISFPPVANVSAVRVLVTALDDNGEVGGLPPSWWGSSNAYPVIYGVEAYGPGTVLTGDVPQTITFASAAPNTAAADGSSDSGTYAVLALGNASNEALSYSIDPTTSTVSGTPVCTLDGTTVEYGQAPGTCVIDATQVANDTFASGSGQQSFAITEAPTELTQSGDVTASVTSGSAYSGQLAVSDGIGNVDYVEADSADSADVIVSSTGAITGSSSLAAGTYAVSGTDTDTNGDSGTWTFTLTVTATTSTSSPSGMGASGGGSDDGSGGGSPSGATPSAGSGGDSGVAIPLPPAPPSHPVPTTTTTTLPEAPQGGPEISPGSSIPAAAFGTPKTALIDASTRAPTLAVSSMGAHVNLQVPSGALPDQTTVALAPVAKAAALQALLPPHQSLVTAADISWNAQSDRPLETSKPLHITFADTSIRKGDRAYTITAAGLRFRGEATRNGVVTLAGTSAFAVLVTAAPRFLPLTRAIKLSASWATLRFHCEALVSCRGEVRLSTLLESRTSSSPLRSRMTVVAAARFAAHAGQVELVKLRTTPAGRTLLASARSSSHMASLEVATDGAAPNRVRLRLDAQR